MSQLINISDDVYEALTKLKKLKNASYSQVIRQHLGSGQAVSISFEQMIDEIEKSEPKPKKLEKTDHDLAAYGVSRGDS